MKIYLAAKYRRRFELRAVADRFREDGHEVTSQWLDNGEEEADGPAAAAQMDVDDVLRADTIVFVGEDAGSSNTGGGRWFELGLAYAHGKRLLIVLGSTGDGAHLGSAATGHETVFTSLPQMEVYASIDDVVRILKEPPRPPEEPADFASPND